MGGNHSSEKTVADDIQYHDPDSIVLKMAAIGNPDFIVLPKSVVSQIRFVEVKYGKGKVFPHQKAVHEELRKQGFQVDVIRADEVPVHPVSSDDPTCHDCGKPLLFSDDEWICTSCDEEGV
jgi:hypothetical protein